MPTHVVRYEDLLSNPYDTLIEVFKFLLNRTDNLGGTLAEARIRELCNKDKPEVYKPRIGKTNASLKYYSDIQINRLSDILYKYLKRFGYL